MGIRRVRKQVVDRNLGNRKLPLVAVRAADNVGQGQSGASRSDGGWALVRLGTSVEVRLHGCESRGCVVLKRQSPQAGQLNAGEQRPQARRVSRCGDGGMIRSGGQRVVRKGG